MDHVASAALTPANGDNPQIAKDRATIEQQLGRLAFLTMCVNNRLTVNTATPATQLARLAATCAQAVWALERGLSDDPETAAALDSATKALALKPAARRSLRK